MLTLQIDNIYSLNPSSEHLSGDVWHELPTFGTLPMAYLPGIVITPSCDLAQKKTDTITYLPIVPLTSYFGLPCVLHDLIRLICGQITTAGLGEIFPPPLSKFRVPDYSYVDLVSRSISEAKARSKMGNKEMQAIIKLESGIKILKEMYGNESKLPTISLSDILVIFGDNFLDKIIKNSNTQTHFLPKDDQHIDWSGMYRHSVALFRYPISIPFEILECAQDVPDTSWLDEMNLISKQYPVAKEFFKCKPMKRITLREPFSSDLLTRYIGLYVRLGSPDFTPGAVQKFKIEMGEEK